MKSLNMQSPGARALLFALLLVSVVYLATTRTTSEGSSFQTPQGSHTDIEGASQQWNEAIDFRLVGLIFYGRREFVSILDCYLQACY